LFQISNALHLKTCYLHINRGFLAAIALVLILSFGLQVLNKALYSHVHVMADGTLVTHAHPFDKSSDQEPVKHHEHTYGEWQILEIGRNLYLVFPALLFLIFNFLLTVIAEKPVFTPITTEYFVISGRAPPFE